MIIDYFMQVRAVILKFAHITDDFDLSEKVYNDNKGFITGRLIFFNESILEFGEVKDIQFPYRLKYRFHFMDKFGNLIFRYDNAKHFPELDSFPHHKHMPNEVIPSGEPDISSVLKEIEVIILKDKSGSISEA
jgi:hypothetical protein